MSTRACARPRIKRVLSINKHHDPAEALRLSDHVQCERRLAEGLRTVDLHDAAAPQATDARAMSSDSAPVGIDEDFLEQDHQHQPHDEALAELSTDAPVARSRAWRLSFLLSAVHGLLHVKVMHGYVAGVAHEAVNVQRCPPSSHQAVTPLRSMH